MHPTMVVRLLMVLAMTATATATAQTGRQTVVFVCEHGAAKSVVAAAHFNKLAAERGLPFRAISRGTAPDPAVSAGVSTGLQVEGLALPAGFAPALVHGGDVAAAARVVTFDVTLMVEAGSPPVTRWDGLPAFSDGYPAASTAIAAKVDALLRELAAPAPAK